MAPVAHRDIEELLPKLGAFARRLTNNHADADDLVQASIERALKKMDQFTPGTNFKAWLFTIMRNHHINEIRSRARRGTQTDAQDCEDLFPVAARQDDRLALRDVVRAYGNLADPQRRVIDLVAVEGWSYQEAADKLDVPVGTVRSRLSRARSQLNDYLDADHLVVVTPTTDPELAQVQ